jgi:hypothetical protein
MEAAVSFLNSAMRGTEPSATSTINWLEADALSETGAKGPVPRKISWLGC